MKKPLYVGAIALAIAMLVLTSATTAFSTPAVSEHSEKNYSAVKMAKATQEKVNIVAPSEPKQSAVYAEPRTWTWRHHQTPSIAETHDGVVAQCNRMIRDDIDLVAHTGSAWDGKPFDVSPTDQRLFNLWGTGSWWYCIYWTGSENIGCHHPTMDYRGMNGTKRVFIGSFVGVDGLTWSSGDPFVSRCEGRPNVQESWTGSSWSFSDNGWLGMKSVDIACDTTDDQFWRWGVMSLVISNDTGLQDGPALMFQYNDTGYATLSYFIISGAETTHCDIDEAAQMAYSVYDYLNFETFQYELFVRTDNWAEMKQYTGEGSDWTTSGVTWSFEDPVLGIREPAVAAVNNNILVVTEITNDSAPNDHDIICWYTDDGNTSNFEISVVAGSTASEKHPEIQYVGGDSFVCAFYMDGKVYRSRTNDNGATWSDPILVSGTDSVIDDHGTIDISNGGTKIIYPYVYDANQWQLKIARLESRVYVPGVMGVTLWDAMTTCPLGDGPTYAYQITVTVWDANGDPVPGITAASFAFTAIQAEAVNWTIPYDPNTHYYGNLGCTFVPVDAQTNANGEIRFTVKGDTSILGDVEITATVNSQPINDKDRLACKSVDYNYDGTVGLGDFVTFASDYAGTRWRSDFTNDGQVALGDFVTFAGHYAHHHP